MATSVGSYTGPDRRHLSSVGSAWPMLVVVVVGLATWGLHESSGDEPVHYVASMQGVVVLALTVLLVLQWARWRWFGDARFAHLGVASAGLCAGFTALTFGHSITPAWDEGPTRVVVVACLAVVVAGVFGALRSPAVDTGLGLARVAGPGVASLVGAALLAWPLVGELDTDAVAAGSGVVLVLAGAGGLLAVRLRSAMGWVLAATAVIGFANLVHALQEPHEQFDLLAVHATLVMACAIGALIELSRVLERDRERGRARHQQAHGLRRPPPGGMSRLTVHEVRNAILALDGATSVALSRSEQDLEVQALRDAVSGEFSRLRALLERDLAQVRHVADEEPRDGRGGTFDAAPVVERQVMLVRSLGVPIHCRLTRPLLVHGSVDEVVEIVQNLLLNAVRHAPGPHGVEVWAETDGEHATIVLADRGPGIPAEVGATVRDGPVHSDEGSGIGLHACVTMARRQGGALHLDSRPGGGSLVRLVLRRAVGDAPLAAHVRVPTG